MLNYVQSIAKELSIEEASSAKSLLLFSIIWECFDFHVVIIAFENTMNC